MTRVHDARARVRVCFPGITLGEVDEEVAKRAGSRLALSRSSRVGSGGASVSAGVRIDDGDSAGIGDGVDGDSANGAPVGGATKLHMRSLVSSLDYSTIPIPKHVEVPKLLFKPPPAPLPGTNTFIPALPTKSTSAIAAVKSKRMSAP